jgi:hypothetical protein
VGGLSCAFNATVYEDTLEEVPGLVQWAQDHLDLVDVMVFIVYRQAINRGEFDFYRLGQKVDSAPLKYAVEEKTQRIDVSSREVVRTIQARFPDFQPAAYLGGTEKPDSLKWLLSGRFGFPAKGGKPSQVLGYVGPKFMEYVQTAHHLLTGRYLAYASKGSLEAGRSALALGVIEPGVRSAAAHYLAHLVKRPRELTRTVHFQSVMVIQPIDMLPDGRQNMCDGCPDVTVHEGQLVYSCRLDEYQKYGGLATCAPRSCGRAPSGTGS